MPFCLSNWILPFSVFKIGLPHQIGFRQWGQIFIESNCQHLFLWKSVFDSNWIFLVKVWFSTLAQDRSRERRFAASWICAGRFRICQCVLSNLWQVLYHLHRNSASCSTSYEWEKVGVPSREEITSTDLSADSLDKCNYDSRSGAAAWESSHHPTYSSSHQPSHY